MKTEYVIGGILVIALGAGAYLLLGTSRSTPLSTDAIGLNMAQKEARYAKAPELVSPDGYINTPRLPSGQAGPITIGEFKGKNPVLIDIWTYSCINCQRTLPYLKMWYEKYRDQGLVIIGVHTPEFAFEKVQKNVENSVKEFGLKYPVVLDNEYKTWNAFGNRFWPRKYLVDIDGYIVYDHAGEGAYEETERAIQKLLAERAERLGTALPSQSVSSPAGAIVADFSQVRSPEVYFGSERNELLGNGEIGVTGLQRLDLPAKLFANTLYLGGDWDIQPEYARAAGRGVGIQFIYSAKNVYIVASAETPVRIKVTRDGKPLGGERGEDVDEAGFVTVQEERLYKLVEGKDYGTHLLEITVEGEGVRVYTFTFG
ncbi:redoxin family protein [Candidatus Kaiserbacteria bacterium]|nr:redoxin family protein [Candidatus Kaiserbacteria bacterium]